MRRGWSAYMGLPERIDTIWNLELNWTVLSFSGFVRVQQRKGRVVNQTNIGTGSSLERHNIGESLLMRRGWSAYMGLPERLDTILNWTELDWTELPFSSQHPWIFFFSFLLLFGFVLFCLFALLIGCWLVGWLFGAFEFVHAERSTFLGCIYISIYSIP